MTLTILPIWEPYMGIVVEASRLSTDNLDEISEAADEAEYPEIADITLKEFGR